MPLHPRTCSGLYSFSCILDAADGLAARRYNQSTTFGAVLDMVTDRCTTSCLLVFLASAFPRWSIIFQGLISLDLASHYIHMYASLTTGGQSHKKVEASRSWVLHLYYTNKVRFRPSCDPGVETGVFANTGKRFAGRALPLLRAQRTLLHRPVPPLLLVTTTLTFPSRGRRQRRTDYILVRAARLPGPPEAQQHLCEPVECGRHGTCACQQDGQHNPLDPGWDLIPRHVRQAGHQCHSADQGEQVARRGRCCGAEEGRHCEEEEEGVNDKRVLGLSM